MNEITTNNFATDSLENLRRRLLDLTARNRLLSFTHGRQGNIRIIDELPNEIHRMLLSEAELRFQAIPDPTREQLTKAEYIGIDPETGADVRLKRDPTASEWARVLGFDTSYELPRPAGEAGLHAKHTDNVIQTLMFPAELETRLRALRNKADTAIEETGTNICFVAFGFLEWFEGPSSETPRHAPLLLVPVRIAKGRLDIASGTYHYTIAYTGEDIIANLSLREKLRIDFGLALPELDESTAPEDYFAEVERLIEKPQPRWRVRRFATVALFNFSKLLMYLDLDPARWPDDKPITAHPIVSRFFAASGQETGANGFGEEYPLDDLPDIHERYPIIDDADSSQHSALVDAMDGRNLVIEGPPGTGKSQTITNLLAAAMAQGRRVLFIAEKLAALEVVKRRLDQAGLGDFCLELHSHKTQKRKVLDDIAARLTRHGQYRHPEQIDADIRRYEDLKRELGAHAERINSHWKRTGRTVHEIFMAASRYRQQLRLDPSSLHPEGCDGEAFTADRQRSSWDTVRIFADVYRQIAFQIDADGDLQSHPWFGVRNRNLQVFDADRVCAALASWQNALSGLAETVKAAGALLEAPDAEALRDLTAIETLMADLARLPPLHGDEVLTALPHLRGDNLAALTHHLQLAHTLRGHRRALLERVRPDCLDSAEAQAQLRGALSALMGLGLDKATRLETLARHRQRIERLQARLAELDEQRAELARHLGPASAAALQDSVAGLMELRGLVELTGRLEPALLKRRDPCFDDDALDGLLPELRARLLATSAAREDLTAWFAVDRLPPIDGLEDLRARLAKTGVWQWLSGGWRDARRFLLQLAARPGVRFKDLRGRLDQVIAYARDRQTLEQDPRYRQALGDQFTGLQTPIADLLELRAWYRAVRGRYGIGFGPKVALGDALLDMPANVARGIQSLAQQGLADRIDAALAELRELGSAFDRHPPLQQGDAPLLGPDAPLSALQALLASALGAVQTRLTDPGAALADLEATVDGMDRYAALLQDWRNSLLDPRWFGGRIDLTGEPAELDEAALSAAARTEALVRFIEEGIETAILRDALYRDPTRERFAELRRLGEAIAAAWQRQLAEREPFAALTELDLDAWRRKAEGTLDGLLARNQRAFDRPEWLANWLDYVRERHRADNAGFARLTAAVEQGVLPADEVDAGYALAVNDLLARQILDEIPALAQFSGNAHLALQRQFRHYDERLKALQRERIAWRIARNEIPAGALGGKVSSYTELALLRHESTKKTRHLPLRQLVARAGNALAALKPCFMMGPMSVAQYLPPGQLEFDLVVMDEASQMKPEDALGAIARGGQLVVVGDPKQLPPTSFFDKMVNDEEEDITAIEDAESILDTAMPLFDARRLRWHYRSRHEHLIAFSNHAFYDGNLVLFPAPHSESDELGVKFSRVPGGRFVNRRNVEEARVIAAAVQRHLLHRPHESLGVVAMSAEQRDQIERAVEERAKDDPLFQRALEENLLLDEPLFIKNLENVQGDERDVIYISCTYGPEEVGGKVYQRFGPINSDVGWRRLNVLFTRSKKRMHVFSSMGSEDIVISERSRRGVIALKDFLAFAESGHLHRAAITGRAPASDFEVAVAAALAAAGFECVPQVGVAGFFIDIAVRDPGDPGRYLMGIECDGASYHSGKSVRDRDRLRQAVLERLGWRIRRIWSTDWYRNPQAEIEPLIRELNGLKTEPQPMPEPEPAAEPTVAETAEVAEVAQIVEQEAAQDRALAAAIPQELSLREKLVRFERDAIRPELPDTPENQRLLRPAMLEALLEFMPITKSEFVETIPLYLRQATSPQEGRFLDQVLKIIEESEVAQAA